MRLSTKGIVARDVEEALRDLDEATISLKTSAARSNELLKIDKRLLTRSGQRIGKVRHRFQQRDSSHREMLERHLEQARGHCVSGEKHITGQRALIAELERDGHDASNAKRLLALFEEIQAMHIAHADRLARQLGIVS